MFRGHPAALCEWLIQYILVLDSTPIVSRLNPIKIGTMVAEMITGDQDAEFSAVHAYKTAISLGREVSDQASVDLLTHILKMEEGRVDWAEMQWEGWRIASGRWIQLFARPQ